jgi:hypothetical protein
VTGSASHPSTRSAADRPPPAQDAGRCPRCNARVRPEYAWCALCHLDLRPHPAPKPDVPENPEAPAPEESDGGPAARDGDLPGDPGVDAQERAAAEAEALVMLHHLRASESAAGMPALASLGPGGRAMLALAIGTALVLLLLGGSAVVGLLL